MVQIYKTHLIILDTAHVLQSTEHNNQYRATAVTVAESEEDMKENRLWYAIMYDKEDTDWGYGSFNYDEAVNMLLECDMYNLIAVIENDVCIEEIYKQDLIDNA